MAAPSLSSALIEAGGHLLVALDDAGLRAQGAAWLFDHGLGDWRFVVATPLVDSKGRLWVYKQLVKLTGKLNLSEEMTITDIQLIGVENPLFRLLVQGVEVKDGGVVVFENSTIDGVMFDGRIYRWTRSALAPGDVKKLEKSFERRVNQLAG
jgi:hypothetical protein